MSRDKAKAISWLPRISMGLTIAQLSARLRCVECGGQLHSVKPWRPTNTKGKEPCRSPGVLYVVPIQT
jgi:hypothetical protein